MEELRSLWAGGWKVENSGAAFDYGEVFGGLAGSYSIPFLELPPALDDDSRGLLRSLGFDYGEIFGGFSEGELGVTYEELVAQPERPESSSENGRAPEESGFVQTVTEVEFPPDVSDGDHFACLNGEQFLSNSDHSDDGSTQFNMTFQKTSRGSREDAINGATTEIAQLHRVPASNFVIDARSSLHNEVKDITPNMVTNDLQMDSNGGINDGNQEICPATSSGSSTQHSVTSREDQMPLTANDPAADVSTNVKDHSHSSSYHSTSSGDISYTDATYVTVSDISLRTRPLRVPPPSRPPPKLVNQQGIPLENMCTNSKADLDDVSLLRPMMNYQTRCDGSVPKEHSPQDNAKSSSFCVVEVNATSAAAASAAAMKEAMEQAQARLKSAKELMERKRDNAQSRKKFGHHDGIKYKERYGDKAAHQVQDLHEEMVQDLQVTFVNEDQNMNFAVGEWKKLKSRIATDHEEKERHADEKFQQTIQMEEFKSSHVLYDLAEGTGEQQKDKEFYELINNDKNFKIVREVTGHEGIEKKTEATAKSNRDKENDTKMPKRNRKLWEISDARGCEVKDKILRAGNVASSEKEIKEIPCSSPDVCVQKENVNKLNVNHDSHKQQENKEKIKLAWENSVDKEEEEEMVFTEEASPGWKRGEKLEPFKDAYKCEKDQRSEAEERRSEAKIFHGCEVHDEKDSNEPYVTCEPHVSKMKLKQANKSGILDIDTKEIRVPNGLSVAEVAEKLKEGQVAAECEAFEGGKRAAKLQCSIDENVNHLKGTTIPFDEQESENLNSRPEACHWVQNNEKLEVNEEAHALEENRKKPEIPEENRMELEISEEALGQTENEKKMDSAKEALGQDHRERKAGEVEQNEKKQKHAQVICDLEVSAQKLKVAEGGHGHEEHGKNEEVQAANEPESKCNGVNETEDICLRVANEFLETLQLDSLFKKKGDILVSAEDTAESSETILAEKTIPDAREDDKKERESKMKKERQQEKEQSRKAEEEKEREREREKDRLAVERATREAHERALAEARERAERIAVERVTAEARQRALAEAREKAASGALERSLTEKASREARLKAERSAVERATAEARERAVERVLAEKAVSDARERAERLNATSRDRLRKDYELAGSFRASGKEASGTRMKTNSFDNPYAGQYQGVGSSSSFQRHSHNNVPTQKFEGAQTESALRSKARLERQQRTVERAAKALAEKNLRDILAQREQAERNRLAESLDAEIRRWSSGKEGNLRALLSTLQYILGPESGWQPIPLTDVITAAAAKKAYRKATLCVHPDKLQQKGASIQQKYICEKVFDLLKEAWNKFNSEER